MIQTVKEIKLILEFKGYRVLEAENGVNGV